MKAGGVVQNVICCGHCQNTSIQRMAFSPNDSILVGLEGCLDTVTVALPELHIAYVQAHCLEYAAIWYL